MLKTRRSFKVKLLSKLAWAIALVGGALTVSSALQGCGGMFAKYGGPAPKYGAYYSDGGTDGGTDGG